MASNKKAQILAAVMCASSIFGSYTMVSAESSISGNNSSVVAGNGTITATAENGSNQTSKITLNGNSLSIDLAKNNNVYDGTFSLNSKYLNVNKYNGTVTVKGWIQEIRNLGGISFIVLRDRFGTVQITLPKKKMDAELFTRLTTLSRESVSRFSMPGFTMRRSTRISILCFLFFSSLISSESS